MTHSAFIHPSCASGVAKTAEASTDLRRLEGASEESTFVGVIKDTQRSRLRGRLSPETSEGVELPTGIPLSIPVERRDSGAAGQAEVMARSIRAQSLNDGERALRTIVVEDAKRSVSLGPTSGSEGVVRLLDSQALRIPAPVLAGGASLCEVHLAENLNRMVKDGVQYAVIRLSPEGLGELEIRLTLEGSGIGVEFGSPLEATRGLLEQAIPRLSELMSQGGLTLNHTQVLSGLSREGWVIFGRPLMTLERPQPPPDAPMTDEQAPSRPGKRRLLDLYA